MKFEKFNITLSLPVERVNQLAGLTALMNAYDMKHGGTCQVAEVDVLASVVDTYLEECLKKEISLFAEQEPETVSNAEEASVPASAVADAREEEPETVSDTEETTGPASSHAEEELETVSNAEETLGPASGHAEESPQDSGDAPTKPAGLLMEDRTDSYVYYLEHGRWPPDSDGERKNEAA